MQTAHTFIVQAFSSELAAFSTEDLVRNQLLFQRNVPGFEPSAASYELAVRFYDWAVDLLRAAGFRDQADVDLFTAFHAGLVEQQLANEPGGRRWIRQLDRMIDMLVREFD